MGEHVGTASRSETYGEIAGFAVHHVTDGGIGPLFDPQHLPGVLEIDFALRGGLPLCLITDKERRIQFPLQLQKLLGKGRLGNEELFRCLRDVPLIGDLNDVFNLLGIHARPHDSMLYNKNNLFSANYN